MTGKSWKFYLVSYLIMIGFAIIGLVYNIKTVAINDLSQKASRDIHQLTEENRKFELHFLQKTSLRKLELKAKKLGLTKAETLKYIEKRQK